MQVQTKMMAASSNRSSLGFILATLLLLQLLYSGCVRVSAAESSERYRQCNGSIAECSEEEEVLMESEISRRFLAQSNSIGYGALKPNQPACGGPKGTSYSGSCLPNPSNPQNRGCSKIYRCRTGSS
nr:TPA_asm: hypothetical protein HUJ06_025596 [Nelumbo nucifera]